MVSTVLLPGDNVDLTQLPPTGKRRIGPGLKQNPTNDNYFSTIAGNLQVDYKKRSAQISTPNACYVPRQGDLVIAQVSRSSQEAFQLYLNPHSPQAFLPQLAFEGASKKTRPVLKPNDIVYAKVLSAQKNMEVELTCVNPSTGKSEPDGLGPLSGGMVFDISLGLADRLLKKQGVVVLDELGAKFQGGFEVAVGKNGKIWVDCPDAGVRGITAIGKCLKETDDGNLREKEQKKLASSVALEMGLT